MSGSGSGASADDPIVIMKYANRRLYNKGTSSYVTLQDVSEMVREGLEFIVLDNKTGEDITRAVLAQIIFEQENKAHDGDGQHLLPVQFLRRLIRVYGDSMQGLVPSYLEMSMESFSRQQDQFREQVTRAFGAGVPNLFEDQVRKNMALFEQAMRVWSPFAATGTFNRPEGEGPSPESQSDISELRKQLEIIQSQLEALAKNRKP